jgi:hypothetical protein
VRTVTLSLVLLLTACASAPSKPAEDESEVSASEVPQLVRDAITKAYPSATASEWSREVEDGVTYFEASLKIAGPAMRSMDVLVRAKDGQIVEEEERIDASALPEAVAKALAAEPYAGLKLRRAERVVKNGKRDEPLYEVLIGEADHAREVVFDARGRIVEQEDKSAGDEEG